MATRTSNGPRSSGCSKRHQVDKLVDVRTWPYSRYPHFTRGFLQRTLPPGMYEHWPSLGGKQQIEPPAVVRALRQLINRDNGQRRTCLICSESDHWQCHRHKMLTPILVQQLGWRVLQITRKGDVVEDHGPQSNLTLPL